MGQVFLGEETLSLWAFARGVDWNSESSPKQEGRIRMTKFVQFIETNQVQRDTRNFVCKQGQQFTWKFMCTWTKHKV